MPACPSCRRPVATARPRCLYCGACLPAASLVTAAPQAPPASTRVLLVLALDGVDSRVLASGLRVGSYQARQLARRGGFLLHRVAEELEGTAEANRLEQAGLTVCTITEADVLAARDPRPAEAGRLDPPALRLETAGGELVLGPADLLLVTEGTILRERQAEPARRRVRTATLEPGYRVHLHRWEDPQPVELDPARLRLLGSGAASSSVRLELARWVEWLTAGGTPWDDGFRRLPPVLAPANPDAEQDVAAVALGGRTGRPRNEGPVVLDNLAQYRFYSAWRAALERARRPKPG